MRRWPPVSARPASITIRSSRRSARATRRRGAWHRWRCARQPFGKVNGAASQTAAAHNATYAKHLAALGEPSEALDAQAMHALTGSRYYSSGLYTPGTVVLQPAGYIRGLAAGLARSGVRVFEESAVTDFARDGLGWAVRCAGGCVRADKVILTVNGHLESFGIETGRLMQLFLFATMTPDLDREALARLGGAPRWGITPSDPMGTTVRRIDTPLGGNRIITRTCATLRPGMRAHGTDLARAERVMRSKFEDRFPQLAGLKMEYSWAGHLCLSRNNVAVMREVEEGVFTGCVQNGLGTARGTLTGMGAAELACGVVSDVTRRFQVEPRPVRLPPQPFLGIGANAVLRWKEWTARTE
ncbi:MAG: FAD-binding oxidoreductase [Pseudomonadota bacterium]